MKLNTNPTNKSTYFTYLLIFVFLFLLSAAVFAYTRSVPDPGHGGGTILVSVGGQEMTLQEAVDNNFFTPRQTEIDYGQCVSKEGWCEGELFCPDSYALVEINPGAPCGRLDGRYPSAIKCCLFK